MIVLGCDGAAVNLGSKKGLAALLKKDVAPRLVSMHCFSHRIELAVRDAFSNTYFSTVFKSFTRLYYVYHTSPKKLRELRQIAAIMEANILKFKKKHKLKLEAC